MSLDLEQLYFDCPNDDLNHSHINKSEEQFKISLKRIYDESELHKKSFSNHQKLSWTDLTLQTTEHQNKVRLKCFINFLQKSYINTTF